jgi:L-iditol 2-dehydrogenase
MTQIPTTAIGLGKMEPGVGHLGMLEHPVRRPEPGEVLIEVIATGVCGTDIHIEDDEFPSIPPVIMGHEVTGEVAEVGSGVDGSWLGKRVTCETYFSTCRECEFCRSGHPNLCADRRSIGSKVNGGFTRWMTLPARNLYELPDHVGWHAGALTEPLACVTECLFDPPVVNGGDRVLVIGPGAMGLLTAQCARAAGGRVLLVGLERDRHRLELAESLGFETRALTGDDGPLMDAPPDVVCECSGTNPGAVLGLDQAGKGGAFVQVGIFGSPVTVDMDRVLFSDLTYTSGNASTPMSWRRALALLREGLVELDPLATDVVPLSQWQRAFAATRAGEGIKWVLDPRAD